MGQLIKQRLAENKLVRIFAVGRLVHPVTVEVFGCAGGFHAAWFDQEHCGLTYEQVLHLAIACRANGLDSFARVAPYDYSVATQFLEAGAGGLMAARIESAQHAEQFVQWAKFAPRGSRGMNNSGRDADYSFLAQGAFAEQANREQFLAIQIETLGALEAADAIAAIDGVDLLFVGPSDLSQALGRLGQFDHADVWSAIDRVAGACRRHQKHWGIVPAGPEYAQKAFDKGCRMISLTNDVLTMRRGLEAIQKAYAACFND